MGAAMTVHGKHGGTARIMDDYLVNQTREEQIERQKLMIKTWRDICCKYRASGLAQREEAWENT